MARHTNRVHPNDLAHPDDLPEGLQGPAYIPGQIPRSPDQLNWLGPTVFLVLLASALAVSRILDEAQSAQETALELGNTP